MNCSHLGQALIHQARCRSFLSPPTHLALRRRFYVQTSVPLLQQQLLQSPQSATRADLEPASSLWPSRSSRASLVPPPKNTRHFPVRRYSQFTKMTLNNFTKKHKVTVIGSGNWGTTVAKLVAENCAEHPNTFEKDVQMWVYEENVTLPKDSKHFDASIGEQPQKLTHIINTYHENVKYLPGIPLPQNIVANPSLVDAVKDSSILIFNLPHEFIGNICRQIKDHIAPYARGISCIKGVSVTDDKIELICNYISENLNIYCGALSGANIASEIANEQWCETTIAYNTPVVDKRDENGRPVADGESNSNDVASGHSKELTPLPLDYPPLDHDEWALLFSRPYFTVSMVSDIVGVSLAGALKNIVAIACGYVEGHGWNMTAKTAVMRRGMQETIRFANEFFPGQIEPSTFWEESAGWGDMIVSCTSARNWRCSKLAVERNLPIEEVEKTELNGQKLQGISTTREVCSFLRAKGAEERYPVFMAVERIINQEIKVEEIPKLFK
ncbi:NAD-dependent glycerol-3-phosphate dehydrogenase N-terminus-domain-containing protein [Pseudoneurospora amorphoporcata]|uniref:Glycerol-3-phosphate dehydrogenase [NAD(+)] n=1 Tax=Pseudoneurospora amorphoporcata TaxID=241081 RepID=A0AAN6SF85_9PEZI|nr:NAD-dependent glycerol-3-phosphate dehydrogenase N-terminus-domain-containing protein [Pseudoneurospora amorphoporcata]